VKAFIDLLLTVVKIAGRPTKPMAGKANYGSVDFGLASNIPVPEDRSRKVNVSIMTIDRIHENPMSSAEQAQPGKLISA
jgi:hypothetical protein